MWQLGSLIGGEGLGGCSLSNTFIGLLYRRIPYWSHLKSSLRNISVATSLPQRSSVFEIKEQKAQDTRSYRTVSLVEMMMMMLMMMMMHLKMNKPLKC